MAEQTKEYYMQQLNITKQVKDRPGEGECCANLGVTFYRLSDFHKAIEYQERSLSIAKEVRDRLGDRKCYANLSNGYHHLGDFRKAIEYQERSLSIAKEVGDRLGEGKCYANHGYHDLGDFQTAIEYQERSLSIAKEVGDRLGEEKCYANLGNGYHDLGDFQTAIEYQERSLSIVKEVGDRLREGHCYANLGNVYHHLGDFRGAIEYQELRLSIAKKLGNLAEEARTYYALGCDYQAFGSLREALDCFQASVALMHSEKISPVSNLYQDVHTHLWRTLLQIERTEEALLVAEQGRALALIDLFYDVDSRPYGPIVVTADILSCISTQTAFVALEGETINFWVCCKETGVQFIQKKVESEDENATAFTQRLIDSACKEIRRGVERAGLSDGENRLFRLLYDTVIGPIAHVLNSEELIIVPDGPLRVAPFAAFLDQNSRYLSETTRIRMIPSLTFLKTITSCPADYQRSSGALLVGDPLFGGELKFGQLPFTRKEVEMIGRYLQTAPLTGIKATKEAVLKRITSVALVHIASHCDVNTARIALAPNPARTSKAPIREEEYMLTMADLLAVQVHARLVVLSCAGPNTVRMAHAFLSAGARSVLASLWPIDDEATFEFMKRFYQHLVDGNSASVALQWAMKSLRESEEFGAVLCWAPFVLIGDDVTLEFGGKEEQLVPLEINFRGRPALEAYNKALTKGKACVKRVPVMLIGQDHSGKTSLKKSLMGKPFNPDEDSTVGIDVDPSYFKVSSEIWKAGESAENDQSTNNVEAISFEHHAARLVAEDLNEEKRSTKAMRSENIEFKKESSLDVPSSSSNNAAELPVEMTKIAPSSETARDATVSMHTLKDPKVDARKRLPETFSVPIQRREKHSPLTAKIPDEVAILIKRLLQEVEKVQDEEDIYSVLWDFGGQSVYYTTHPLFITTRAMYLLVYDLSRDPYALAEPVVKEGKYQKILDNHGGKSNLDYLNFWMTSIASLASQDEDQHVHSGQVQVNTPPVFLVCTHADKPYGGANPLALARKVFGFLQTKPYRNYLYNDVFVVDNTKSGTESKCSEVIRLRENVLAVAKELPQMKEPIPIRWLKYEKALQVTAKERHKWISFEMAKQIASEVCQIDDDKELSILLDFLHDQRILIHFDDTAVLNSMVVLDPQWLVDVFKKVITVKPCHQQEKEFEELWWRLECKGILEQKLLEHVWGSLLDEQGTSASLIEIMEKFSLLCPLSSSDASCGKQYLVPSMLRSLPPQDVIKLVDSAQIPSVFFKFESGQVPPGLFPRLVVKLFQWGQDEFWSSENPDLCHGFARFYTLADDECSVILLCHSSSIEIAVCRDILGSDLAESLQSKLNISADANYDGFEVACVRTVCRQLGQMLGCMRKEFCWLKNMKYEVGVMCPICCQGRAAKYNCMHSQQGCKQEECLHFRSESELHKHSIRCRKLPLAQFNNVPVKKMAPWIETLGEQLTLVKRDGRLFTSEEGTPAQDLKRKQEPPFTSAIVKRRKLVTTGKYNKVIGSSAKKHPTAVKQKGTAACSSTSFSERSSIKKQSSAVQRKGTTACSSTTSSERKNLASIVVKEGSPSRDELEEMSPRLGTSWKSLARRLGFPEGKITGFHKDNEEYAEKALMMLFEWKERNGSDATYEALYQALCHHLCGRKSLAQEFCCTSKEKRHPINL